MLQTSSPSLIPLLFVTLGRLILRRKTRRIVLHSHVVLEVIDRDLQRGRYMKLVDYLPVL